MVHETTLYRPGPLHDIETGTVKLRSKSKMDSVLTPFAIGSIAAATVGFGGVAVLFTMLFSKPGVSSVDKLVVIWCVYDAITHFFLVREYTMI